MRLQPIFPAPRFEFDLMQGHAWAPLGGYANCWLIGPLRVIASNDQGWDHVSVSCETRCPSWNEMEFVKRSFFFPYEVAMQLHPAEDQYVNHMPYCLHLWAPQPGLGPFKQIPLPDPRLVGAP